VIPSLSIPRHKQTLYNANYQESAIAMYLAPSAAIENNKRVIDGIPRYWLLKTKRWVYDCDQAGVIAVPTAHVDVPDAYGTSISGVSTITGTTSGNSSGTQYAVANAAHLIKIAIQGLWNSLKDGM
jgi:hypothetical protein